ncbi:MAG: hypothetical protein KDA89_13540 [Planctomycetaceae bacterium]|nr:hypothetical protein [Planctomycetaceae bacterium]
MAFLTRSVRQDSRLTSHHLLRAALGATILYLFWVELETFASRQAAGGVFAATVVYCCYWFLTLVGSIHFSTAIIEEKEEQTLPLLKMTGVSAFSVLAGKSLPRLAVAILFLLVVAPFLILAVTLGGVLAMGILSAILGILCYAVMLSQMGLFAGLVCNTASQAVTLTFVLWGVFEFPGFWAWLIAGLLKGIFGTTFIGTGAESAYESSLPILDGTALLGNLNSTLLTFRGEAVWHLHMTVHLGIAAGFFFVSWLLFERCTSAAVAGDLTPVNASAAGLPGGHRSRAAATVGDSGLSAAAAVSLLPTGNRVWPDALAWKSWKFVSGGRQWLVVRMVGIPALILFGTVLVSIAAGELPDGEDLVGILFWFGLILFLINTARLLGRVLNQEIHDRTLASLIMMPQSTAATAGRLLWGLTPAIASSSATAVISLVLVLLGAARSGDLGDLIEIFTEPWFLHLFSWIILTICTGILFSTHLRFGGMLLAAALLWIVGPMFCGVSFGLLAFAMQSGDEILVRWILPLGLIVTEIGLSIAAWRSTLRRLEQKAAE